MSRSTSKPQPGGRPATADGRDTQSGDTRSGDARNGPNPATLEGQESSMISDEQEREQAPGVDADTEVEVNVADTHELPAADPDPWERGDFENEGPEPARQDADGPGADAGESEAAESEAAEQETQKSEAGDPEASIQADESEAGDPEAGESENDESDASEPDAGIQPEDTGAENPQSVEAGEKEQDDDNAGEGESNGEEADGNETSGEETDPAELKIVLHVRNGRANAGVWRPGTDPHLEVFLETDTDVLMNELPGLIERAQARWADNPMRPKYDPPVKKSKKTNKQTSNKPSGQPSNQPSSQPSGQTQLGNVEEQTGMARLF